MLSWKGSQFRNWNCDLLFIFMPKTKVSAADVEYFSLPKDFASLRNLKDLIQYRSTTLELENSLKQYETNLTKYTKDYFASFTMNLDEVLLYVNDIEEYSIVFTVTIFRTVIRIQVMTINGLIVNSQAEKVFKL